MHMTYRIIKENNIMNMQEATSIMKADSYKMAALSEDTRNNILVHVKDALIAHKDEIFAANAKDMAAAEENGIAASVKKRLKFDEHKLADVTNGIDELIKLPDPVGQIQLKRELDEGLVLQRVSCPIGVIGIIFEARPDALVQISSLCIKSGNCAVLKGGKETANTNKALFDVIYSTAVANGAPEGCMLQASQHNEIDELLSCGSADPTWVKCICAVYNEQHQDSCHGTRRRNLPHIHRQGCRYREGYPYHHRCKNTVHRCLQRNGDTSHPQGCGK